MTPVKLGLFAFLSLCLLVTHGARVVKRMKECVWVDVWMGGSDSDLPLLNSLQVSGSEVSLGDKLSVLVWFSHRGRALSLQRLAATVLTAEACNGAVVPPWNRPPPVGGLYFQHAGSVAAPLPSHLHQAVHCVPRPAGCIRQSCAAALGSPSGKDTGLGRGGCDVGGWYEPHEAGGISVVERGCECALSAAAWRSPPGFPAPAGAVGAGGHTGVTLASADTEIQDLSLGSAQLQPGLDAGTARTRAITALQTFTAIQTSDLLLNTAMLENLVCRCDAFSLCVCFLPLPEADIMAGKYVAALCCLSQQTTEEDKLFSLKL